MRRNGGRLVVDAPHGALLEDPPRIRARMTGDGDGTFTLRIGSNVTLGSGVRIVIWALGTNVLEIGDDTYTRKFGGDRVTRGDVLHVAEHGPKRSASGGPR